TRPAQNAYALASTTNQRVENTQTESVSGSAITNSFTRAPVQPYTYANTAIIAEQFTDTDQRTLSIVTPLTASGPEHPYVTSTTSSTKLEPGAFTPRTADPDTFSDKFSHWQLNVTVTRTDGSLPSGYDGTFSYRYIFPDVNWPWDGSVDLTDHYGDNLPDGSYTVEVLAEEVRGIYAPPILPGGSWELLRNEVRSTYTEAKDFYVGKKLEYEETTTITWPLSTQPQGTAVVFKYRSSGTGSWSEVSPVQNGVNHQATLELLESGDYEYLIEYLDGGETTKVVKAATGIFVVNKTGNTTDSSSSTANFSFSSTKYVEVGDASSIFGYFSEGVASSVSRADIVVRDKLTGDVVSTASSYPADYLAWLKTENPTNYTYNGNLNLSEDFVRHRFNTS
ncbi:hypothetical protein, partial [Microbulbifer sp. TYP-18]|uniref:hypothetical protein n=1 Tax=Microbulbifer sp. TYP-18 TaxID=3230024 RepID=UPI0034C60D86